MNIIVNGGTRGIGREVVSYLTRDINNQIFVTGRNEKALADISARFKNVKTYAVDMSTFDNQTNKFTEIISSNFKKVDILINIAGYLIAKDFVDIVNEDARLMMETNFFGPASVIRILRPMMPAGSHISKHFKYGWFSGQFQI